LVDVLTQTWPADLAAAIWASVAFLVAALLAFAAVFVAAAAGAVVAVVAVVSVVVFVLLDFFVLVVAVVVVVLCGAANANTEAPASRTALRHTVTSLFCFIISVTLLEYCCR
jgi:hypothetical protein